MSSDIRKLANQWRKPAAALFGREVPFAPGYWVTGHGRVTSVQTNWRGLGPREMRQTRNSDGYRSVRPTIAGKRTRYPVHKLVAACWLPPKPSANHEIRHIDGNKANNYFKNLAWGTQQDNADDREAHGRTSRGQSHSAAVKRGLSK